MLNFACKYNWWTNIKDKKNISLNSRIEYILEFWNLKELKEACNKVWINKVKEIYNKKLLNNPFFKNKKQTFLNFFFKTNESK